MPCPDVTQLRRVLGKQLQLSRGSACRERLKEDFVYQFTFPDVSNAWILINSMCFSTWNFKINKNSVPGISSSQLTLTEKIWINNLIPATPGLVISQSSSGRIQTYVRKINPAKSVKNEFLSGYAERSALSGLLINHITFLAPALPGESPASRHWCAVGNGRLLLLQTTDLKKFWE